MASHILLNLALFLVPLIFSTMISTPFELAKWLSAGCILAAMCLVHVFSLSTLKLPAVPRRGVVLILAVIVCQTIGISIHNRFVLNDYIYYLFVLFGYGFFFYNDFLRAGFYVLGVYAKTLLLGSVFIAVIGLSQVWGLKPLHQIMGLGDFEGVASTLGNINYAGQYIGLCVLFFIFGNATSESKVLRWLYFAGIVVSLTYFSFLNTRSIIVGLTSAVSWFVWRGHLLTKTRFVQLVVATTAVITLSHSLGRVTQAREPRGVVGASRQESANIRLDMWAGTARMILDHPLGVGVGNFNFPFVPYRQWAQVSISDNELIASPHNEFLSIAAQSGLPAALMIFFAGFWLLLRFYQARTFAVECTGVYDLFIGLSILFFVEAFFQFPFDGQWSVVVFSMMVAGVSSAVFGSLPTSSKFTGPLALCLAMFALYTAFTWYRSSSAVFQSFDIRNAKLACEARPQDWVACSRYAERLYNIGDIEKMEVLLVRELKRQPNNWLAMGMLAEMSMNNGKEANGCELLRQIDKLYNQKSRAHDFVGAHCLN